MFFIPKKINVGFQNRQDTYTGKLAYVIYYDTKNKLRQEASWNGWRNKDIPNIEFNNEPISGFVLNKNVGGNKTGWNCRNTYIRVYDPRDFEFEIKVSNLLYILENTNSIKGKGLEGEFIYGWDGKDIILIPTGAPDYQSIATANNIIQDKKCISSKELIIGATYLNKDNRSLIYLGKYDFYSGYSFKRTNAGKHFWFAEVDLKVDNDISGEDTHNYILSQKKNISNYLISCIDNECSSFYSNAYEKMVYSSKFSPIASLKNIDMSLEEFKKIVVETIGPYASKKYPDYYFYLYLEKDENLNDILFIKSSEYTHNGYYKTTCPLQSQKLSIEETYENIVPYFIEQYLANGNLYRTVTNVFPYEKSWLE